MHLGNRRRLADNPKERVLPRLVRPDLLSMDSVAPVKKALLEHLADHHGVMEIGPRKKFRYLPREENGPPS